jgi:glycosyltransferase involved in cell wall biosynthesis
VTLSHAAAASLAGAYGADPARIAVLPHGVLDLPLVDPLPMKPALELDGREVILSFGLLGPGKGCERVIDALPAIAATHPTVVYAIVGTTRADLPPAVRDAYAASLAARARALGVEERVRLVDRFVGRVELSRWLEAADVFVASTRVTETAGTGTIAYAMGAGRAVVSTPSPGAAELLADERGVLVSTGSPAELARAIGDLLSDGERRTAIGGRAYEHTRPMVWSQVGDRYRELFTEATSGRMPRERPDPAGRSPARRMGVGAAVEPITRAAAPGAART